MTAPEFLLILAALNAAALWLLAIEDTAHHQENQS